MRSRWTRVTADNMQNAHSGHREKGFARHDRRTERLPRDGHELQHDTINHSDGVYVRGNIHTNTVEGFFGLLKRGIIGSFHHVSKGHLGRYVDEFQFRYNLRGVSDGERSAALIAATEGKRLTFKQPSGDSAAERERLRKGRRWRNDGGQGNRTPRGSSPISHDRDRPSPEPKQQRLPFDDDDSGGVLR